MGRPRLVAERTCIGRGVSLTPDDLERFDRVAVRYPAGGRGSPR